MILLKPQDIVILLKLSVEREDAVRTFARLGADLGISASEVHASVTRMSAAALVDADSRKPRVQNLLEFLEHGIRFVFIPRRGEITRGIPTAHSAPPLRDLLVQGPTYRPALLAKMHASGSQSASPGDPYTRDTAQPGPLATMYPVGKAGNDPYPLRLGEPGPLSQMFIGQESPPLVWPHPEGDVRGEGLEPLYPSAVDAARRDGRLYECLALVDAIRVGRAREKALAIELLAKRIRS